MWQVDGWQPSYGASFAAPQGPSAPAETKVALDCEIAAGAWAGRDAAPDVRRPDVVLLVDGVRRIDATLWSQEPDGATFPALAVSYAAGVVRCDLGAGRAELVGATVRRGLFTASPTAQPLVTGHVSYPVVHARGAVTIDKLPAAVQSPLTGLEIEVSDQQRVDGDLLVLDGPLRRRDHVRTVGFAKTHERDYLPPEQRTVTTGLAAGQRTPVFQLGPGQPYSWYLRLPGGGGGPWAGVIRVECPGERSTGAAIALADLSQVTLPGLASVSYKDPRAPQNLAPVAGLERRLRALLGDSRLLRRSILLATRAGARS
ncbi:hypothetical protein GCM10010201_29010 [Pilimelia columellifera subsp. columellifera]|uniref:Uncharacterized protein n=2 Tax=Pilimelia TaxID=53370 RepID=A0ABN3NQI0_9ACTN